MAYDVLTEQLDRIHLMVWATDYQRAYEQAKPLLSDYSSLFANAERAQTAFDQEVRAQTREVLEALAEEELSGAERARLARMIAIASVEMSPAQASLIHLYPFARELERLIAQVPAEAGVTRGDHESSGFSYTIRPLPEWRFVMRAYALDDGRVSWREFPDRLGQQFAIARIWPDPSVDTLSDAPLLNRDEGLPQYLLRGYSTGGLLEVAVMGPDMMSATLTTTLREFDPEPIFNTVLDAVADGRRSG